MWPLVGESPSTTATALRITEGCRGLLQRGLLRVADGCFDGYGVLVARRNRPTIRPTTWAGPSVVPVAVHVAHRDAGTLRPSLPRVAWQATTPEMCFEVCPLSARGQPFCKFPGGAPASGACLQQPPNTTSMAYHANGELLWVCGHIQANVIDKKKEDHWYHANTDTHTCTDKHGHGL